LVCVSLTLIVLHRLARKSSD